MRTAAQLTANRANAKPSTGPRTAAGKARSSLNALRTGLYANLAVIPALGETPEGWTAFAAAVARDLGADGPVELALADQAAGLLWRLRRIRAAESAAYAPLGLELPPDPDAVTGEGVDHTLPLPPNAPPARKLAHVRAVLRTRRSVLRQTELAVAVVSGDGPVEGGDDWRVADTVAAAAGEELTGRRDPGPVDAAVRLMGEDPVKVAWTADLTRRAVAAAAVSAGQNPIELTAAVATRLRDQCRRLAEGVSKLEAEERELVAAVAAGRARAAVGAALADEGLLLRVAKIEAHLGRELERVLGMLERLRAARADGADGGFVPTVEGVLAGGGPRVLEFREAAE